MPAQRKTETIGDGFAEFPLSFCRPLSGCVPAHSAGYECNAKAGLCETVDSKCPVLSGRLAQPASQTEQDVLESACK